jgi:dephospho-CoA kinase
MILAITGKAGVGKSTIASHIEEIFRIPIIDLDKIGHDLLQTPQITELLVQQFNSAILDENQTISRPLLSKLVFSDFKKLTQLNAIMHPAIKNSVLNYTQQYKPHALIVGALIKEIGLLEHIDHVILITASKKNIKEYSPTKLAIHKFQANDADYKCFSDRIFTNDFTNNLSKDIIQHIYSLLKEIPYD